MARNKYSGRITKSDNKNGGKTQMKIHMMGIGGSGMSGVAKLAENMEYSVTGCDLEENTAYGKNIFKGHSPDHLNDVDLLVISPAILFLNKNNPELVEGQKRGIVMTWEEFLGKVLLKDKKVIAIAGTHGKSTTTAMAGKLLIDAGLDPIVVLGAIVPEWNGSSRFGKGEWAIVEADEFNNNFLNYHPEILVINNIEFDHPDFFKNEEEVLESFEKLKANMVGQKTLISEKDSKGIHFKLQIIGEHNQKNANMVYLLGKELKIDEDLIKKSLSEFKGIGRRMELIVDENGIKVFDDYAHHPTAIKTTLEGVREKYPDAKILVINEPHGFKRTKALLSEYKGVFDSADKVIIGPIFPARDEIDPSVTPQNVALASGHLDTLTFNSSKELIANCKLLIVNYDVVVIMGAGKSYLWAKEIGKMINSPSLSFKNLTTFRVGGKIKHYYEVKTIEEIEKAIDFAKENKLQIFVLGGGSDILVSDKDFEDVVIKYTGKNISKIEENIITAEAGVLWDDLVDYSVKKELWGMECLSGIPGTVGASPIQNIGAYGQEISETFFELKAYDIEKRKFVIFSKEDCKFGYRESIFKQKTHWQKYIICSVTFKLNYKKSEKQIYESLKDFVDENSSVGDIREAVLRTRSQKLENPNEIGNAGSFFKNPVISSKIKEELLKQYPDAKIFPFENNYKVSAAWLIEKCGWKGKSDGNVGVSSKHSLIIVNKTGNATAMEIYDFSETIITDVYKKFNIHLEREVQLINF